MGGDRAGLGLGCRVFNVGRANVNVEKGLYERGATVLVAGVDYPVETLVDLRVGEACGEYANVCPVFEMEFVMALKVSPVSHSREPNVVKGGMAPSRR